MNGSPISLHKINTEAQIMWMMIFTPHAGLIEALKGGKIYYASLPLVAGIRLQICVNLSFPIDSSEKTQIAAGLCHVLRLLSF